MLRYRKDANITKTLVVMTFERRIQASVERVWSFITDPYAMVSTDRHTRVVSTHGEPGEVGSGYSVVFHGITMSRLVVEAVAGELLVLRQDTERNARDGRYPEQRGELRRDGDATLLTWTVTEPPLPMVFQQVATLNMRYGVPRWLSRLERAVEKASTESPR